MAPGIQISGVHWSGFTGDAMKVAKLLVKLKFKEESTNSIIGNGLDSGEELQHLDDNMCKSFIQNFHKSGAVQDGVVLSTMVEVFLKFLVWGLKRMKSVSRTIDVDTIYIEWCRSMNN